jgi:hypothetical protein
MIDRRPAKDRRAVTVRLEASRGTYGSVVFTDRSDWLALLRRTMYERKGDFKLLMQGDSIVRRSGAKE